MLGFLMGKMVGLQIKEISIFVSCAPDFWECVNKWGSIHWDSSTSLIRRPSSLGVRDPNLKVRGIPEHLL